MLPNKSIRRDFLSTEPIEKAKVLFFAEKLSKYSNPIQGRDIWHFCCVKSAIFLIFTVHPMVFN